MPDTNERLQQAIAAARAGNTAEARDLVDGLVEENPNNPHALFLRGMLAGSQEEQIEYLNRVLEIDPDHKAANRRLEQIAPPAETEDATVLITDEPEEVEESEAAEEFGAAETVVGVGALFAADDDDFVQVEEPAEEEGEWGVPETVVTAAAVGAGLEALEEDSTMIEPALSDETVLDEGLAEEESDDGTATIVTAPLSAAAVMSADQSEEVPDWLMAETRTGEEVTAISDEDIWGDAPAEEVQELPDWLTEEPSGTWAESESDETAVFVADEPAEAGFDDSWATEEEQSADQVELDEEEAPEEELTEEEEKPKKKSSTRGLEIALVILIVVALVLVIGLAYVVLNPPF